MCGECRESAPSLGPVVAQSTHCVIEGDFQAVLSDGCAGKEVHMRLVWQD